MPKKPASIAINLIPQDPFFETTVGKILKWALSIGRYIVIFTEIVVIMSFATRFSLDRQITDLNNEINQKQTIIESYGELEQDVRVIQNKILQYQQVEQQANIAEIFPKLSAITPTDIRLNDLTVKLDGITFSGTAYSNNSLNLLINNLQLSQDFYQVAINTIETGEKDDPGFHFRITALTKPPATKTEVVKEKDDVNILDRTQGAEGI